MSAVAGDSKIASRCMRVCSFAPKKVNYTKTTSKRTVTFTTLSSSLPLPAFYDTNTLNLSMK